MNNTSRHCALVYHCIHDSNVYVLLAYSNGELTTIGGRKNKNETDLDCCCREAFEETKELVNYYPYKHGLSAGVICMFSGCSYYIIEEKYEQLNVLCETFKETHSDKKEQNELNELILFNLDRLVEMLILNRVAFKNELKEFILTILYHTLKPSNGKSVFISEIDEPVDLCVSLKALPTTV